MNSVVLFTFFSYPFLICLLASSTTWILELHNGVDNRLTDKLITGAIMPALDFVEKEWRLQRRAEFKDKKESAGKGALIISGAHNQEKFFSNGTYAKHVN